MNSAQTTTTDVAIIGAGTAGMAAYRAALRYTERVVLIENHVYGTTCARVGCMPSKLLIAASEVAHSAHHAGRFGVNVPRIDIDGRAVMQRVRSERDRFVGFVVDTVETWPAAQRWQGHARFVDTHTLAVDGPAGHRQLEAGRIVIASGSRPAVPEGWLAALGDRLIVNDDVFSWTDLPASVAVVGTGVVGLELAQALHRLGVRVRLFGRGSLVGPLTNPTMQSLTRDVFDKELALSLDVQVLQPRREGNEVVMRSVLADGRAQEERFELLLAATGRRANVDNLGLENTSLPLDPQGVPVFDRRTGQVGDSAVFIAGDAADDRPLLHEAADEGRIAGENAGRWPDVRLRPRRASLAVVFSAPQIAMVGASHADLVSSGIHFVVGEVSFADQGRSRVVGLNQGALQVYAENCSGRLLGAEMLGPAAEHLGHLLAWSVQRGDTVQHMLDSPFYHPVVEEGLRTALRDAQRKLQLPTPWPEDCLECGT